MTGWAVLGTGTVSHRWAAGLRTLRGGETLVAVGSRDPGRAAEFAVRHGGRAMSYEDAVTAPGVEAVYVATPTTEHEEHALLSIAAGKAVLVEKPFAADAAAGRRMATAARAAGVFCMEAMWTRFLPMMDTAKALIGSGALGEVRAMSASFMGSDVPDSARSQFDAGRGGGALLQRGVYPLSLARYLLGPADVISATLRMGATGVDEDVAVLLRHAGGAISTLSASLRAQGPNSIQVSGTHGILEIGPPCYRPYRAALRRVEPRGGNAAGLRGRWRDHPVVNSVVQFLPVSLLDRRQAIRKHYTGNGYHYQVAEVTRRLLLGELESPVMPLGESLEILMLVDRIRSLAPTVDGGR